MGKHFMECIKPGHTYFVKLLDSESEYNDQIIQFVDRGHGTDKPGTTCQELLRVLIDRVQFLEKELHWDRNNEIIFHLRKALLLFEIRALERKFEKGELQPEDIIVDDKDGHFRFEERQKEEG
jgi:hypothetical protein